MEEMQDVKIWSSKKIRESFLEFFKERGHTFVPSSSTVPSDDPTLLFTNAGMNQFKNIFLGKVSPDTPTGKLKRACNTQKCIRAGGKHNDLEDVGRDVYHHTFFEMLGNWSFSDYFKIEAIDYAWTLLTEVWKLPTDRLYVTYFGGNSDVLTDTDVRDLWLKRLPKNKVLPFGSKENFWEMGETGPCGPCTEIHYDRIGNRDASKLVNMDDPDVLELWNIVFIQYNRDDCGKLKKLPKVHVDTGMGFERIVSVLQNKRSNYDTDIFTPFFDKIHQITNAPKYQNLVGDFDVDKINMAYRVVADHIRTLTIAISDGCRPSNVGRGYVLRRILRRTVRFAHDKLGFKKGDLALLVDVAVNLLRDIFNEVSVSAENVKNILLAEESQFLKTLSKGETHLNKAIENSKNNILEGNVVWRLYDTYGFPVDLTALIANEKGFKIDIEGFETARTVSQELSRRENSFKTSATLLSVHEIDRLRSLKISKTDSSFKYKFDDHSVYYKFPPIPAKVVALFKDGQMMDNLMCGECMIILDQTNFYAEEGGQLADTGFMSNSACEIIVRDVQCHSGYVMHICSVRGFVSVEDILYCSIDSDRRSRLMKNHSVTHVLNFSLRKILGSTDQKGSLVTPDKLRFDFSSELGLSESQIQLVEKNVNDIIDSNFQVFTSELPLQYAMEIGGIRAVFGESYPDPVRVVSIGISIDDALLSEKIGFEYPIELCGGIHVSQTSDIEGFTILSEEGIGKGVRRIVAVTDEDARDAYIFAENWDQKFMNFSSQYKSLKGQNSDSLLESLSQFATRISNAMKEIANVSMPYLKKSELRKKMEFLRAEVIGDCRKLETCALQNLNNQLKEMSFNDSKSFIVKMLDNPINTKSLDSLGKDFNIPLFIFYRDSKVNKIIYFASVPKSLATLKFSAKMWCSYISQKTSSKSGGKDTSAQGTCPISIDTSIIFQLANDFALKFLIQSNDIN